MNTTDKLILKIQKAFAKLGILADRIEITYPKGFWKKEDVYRLEGYAVLYYSDGRPHKRVQLNSWDTATDCISKGELLLEEIESWEWQINSPSSQIIPD